MSQYTSPRPCPVCGGQVVALLHRDDPDTFDSDGVWVASCEIGCTSYVRDKERAW